jgi:secreted trypsin-like serine protease
MKWGRSGRRITSGHLCTSTSYPPKGACSGDSGGPISCLVDSTYYVTGLVSRVEKECSQTSLPDLYTRVSHYREWIRETMLKN